MRAVIFATGEFWKQDQPGRCGSDPVALPLLSLLDRPFVQHVVEQCVAQGIVHFDWILSHLPEQMEQFLGNGERWGVAFCYHLVRNPRRPYEIFNTLAQTMATEPVVLGHADRLPALDLANLFAPGKSNPSGCVLFTTDGPSGRGEGRWSGWGVVSPSNWQKLRCGPLDESGFLQKLRALSPESLERKKVDSFLSIQSYPEFLQANETVISGRFPGLPGLDPDNTTRIHADRTARIDPSAQLVAPVFIGSHCAIAAGSRIGPHAVVGNNCVIDRNCLITNSVLFSETYVAEGQKLIGHVVDRNQVMSRPTGKRMNSPSLPVGVGSLRPFDWAGFWQQLLSMSLGFVMLLLAAPILALVVLILKIRRGQRGVFHPRQCLRLPASPLAREWKTFSLLSFVLRDEHGPEEKRGSIAGWHHFFLELLPGLIHVTRGDIRLVGLPARSCEEVQHLSEDWQSIYLQGNVGLIHESLILEEKCRAEELFAHEGILILVPAFLLKLRIFLTYFGKMVWRSRRGLANIQGDLYKLGKDGKIMIPDPQEVKTGKGDLSLPGTLTGSPCPEIHLSELGPAVLSPRMSSVNIDLAQSH